jgi:NDP-sugar pyrophosphorylase family protein
MQAIILAGGKGTRLQPYTLVFPKPMLPVGGLPIIQTIVRQLAYYGFDDIVISLGYLGEYIRMFFEDPANVPKGVKNSLFLRRASFGHFGPIALAGDLEENFLVINGDILTTIDYRNFLEAHKKAKAILSLAVAVREIKMSLGMLDLDSRSIVTDFREKPTFKFNDNMGIYIYNRATLEFIEKNKRLDLNDLVLKLIKAKKTVYGYNVSNSPYYWIDIGQHADYEKGE